MNGQRWRCFVAVPIGEALRADLRAAVDGWRGHPDLRWTDPDGWHVTLAFLGSVPAASVPVLVERLAATAVADRVLSVRTGGIGAFPTPARARVAWYGVTDEGGRLSNLASEVAIALGLDSTGLSRPHLTLARARHPVDLRAWLASASAPAGVLDVDRLALMRSHLGRGPARYETLATITLGVPARV